MNNIDIRFLRELFREKEVTLNNNEYKELYKYIWPCEKEFILFLKSSDPSLKLDYAKKIYDFFQTNSNIFIPLNAINNVIDFQSSSLVENTLGYIPQDHVIHSVNLYLTGIYIIFNHKLFNQKLLKEFAPKTSLKEQIKILVEKWRLFSFYHDIGYCLEGYIDKDGHYKPENRVKIKKYENDLLEDIVYLCVTRIVSRLVTIASVVKKSTTCFDFEKYAEDFSEFQDIYNLNSSDINILKSFNNAILLEDVHTFEDVGSIRHILNCLDTLTIVFDETHTPIAIISKKGNHTINFFVKPTIKNLFVSKTNNFDNINEIIKDYQCNYYILEIDKAFHKYGDTLFEKLSQDFFDKLPDDLKQEFNLIYSEKGIEEFFCSVNKWITLKLSNDFLSKSYDCVVDELISSCYKNVFVETFQESINNILKEFKDEKFSPDNIEKYITKTFKKLDTRTLLRKLNDNALKKHEKEDGAFVDILGFGLKVYKELIKHLDNFESKNTASKSLAFFKEDLLHKVKIVPFAHNTENNKTFESKIYDKMVKLSSALKIDFSKLESYKTNYTTCDHGVMSAAILYQCIVLLSRIYEGCSTYDKFKLIWNEKDCSELFENENYIESFADVIFSILLHNIYTKSSADYGIEYKHDININPFSYFSAYCDTIQKWNRPKQINLSKTYLPKTHYLYDLFDIEIKDDYIHIKCLYEDLAITESMIKSSEEFLPGITKITKIKGIDS